MNLDLLKYFKYNYETNLIINIIILKTIKRISRLINQNLKINLSHLSIFQYIGLKHITIIQFISNMILDQLNN